MGSLCAFAFIGYGPQRPEPFAEEEEEEEEKSNTNEEEIIKQAVSEKEEKSQSVNHTACSEVPSGFSDDKSNGTATYPDNEEYIRSNPPVKIK